MRKTFYLFSLILCVIAVGCGSSGLTGIQPDESSNITEVGNPTTEIAGTATKGPLSNARVVVYRLNEDGTLGEILGEGVTDEAGRFIIDGEFSGPVAVVAYGGSYIDEATRTLINNSPEDSLVVLMADPLDYEAISIAPLTAIATSRILSLLGSSHDQNMSDIISMVHQEVAALFGLDGIDIVGTAAADVTDPDAVLDDSQDDVRYGLVLAALSRLLFENNIDPKFLMDLIADIARDYADGIIDNSGLVNNILLPEDVIKELAAATSHFVNSYNSSLVATFKSGLAPDTENNFLDRFGYSVDISGSALILGIPYDDDLGEKTGVVYVYECDKFMTTCFKANKLNPASTNKDLFGTSVAAYENTIVVGSPGNDMPAVDAGVVYIYEKSPDEGWGNLLLAAELFPSVFASFEGFGESVDIDKKTIIIGAPFANSETGETYIYIKRLTNTWTDADEFILNASDGSSGALFGSSVAIHDNIAVVGAPSASMKGENAGAAYVYVRNPDGSWPLVETAKLSADDVASEYNFGTSVFTDGDSIYVGASGAMNSGIRTGAAYVYARNLSEEWILIQKIVAMDGEELALFGSSISVNNNMMTVGAPMVNGAGGRRGSAYVFHRNSEGVWSESLKIYPPLDYQNVGQFGYSVANSDLHVLVGAPSDFDLNLSGNAFLFELSEF